MRLNLNPPRYRIRLLTALLLVFSGWALALLSRPEPSQPDVPYVDTPPEVVEAIRLINLNAAQAKVFKASATTYSNDLRTATAKIFRDKLDIKRKLNKKQRVLAKRMDAQVLEVLNKDQIEAYQAFSKTLDEKVKSFGRRKPRAG